MTIVTALFFIYVGASLDWTNVFETIKKTTQQDGN